MEITYRSVVKEDAISIAALTEELVEAPSDLKRLEEMLEKLSKREEYCVIAACHNKKIVGISQGVICHDICEDCKNFLVIENVIVQKEYRGQGVAEGIFRALEDWGRAHQCYYAILVSGNHRKRAHQFYQKAGYQKEGGFRKYL